MSMPPGEPPAYQYSSGPYPPPQVYYPPPPAARTNVWAILSLIFGILGLIGVPVSVVCGIVGLKRAKQGQGGRGLAIAGLVLSGVWVLLVVGMLAYYLVLSGGNLFAAPPRAGECIAEMPKGDQSVSVKTIDCADPHEGEVVAVLTMPDGSFPGRDVFAEYRRKCESELASYSPGATRDPSIDLFVRYSTESLWDRDYREVTCVATLDPPRTGSIKG